MNEFDYDVLQRKRLAQQARRKKHGGTRMCRLPSDNLTPKQWRERNGEVMTYNISKPMDWETFKALPVDIQGEYITNLCEKHGGNQQRICRELFKICPATFHAHLAEVGIKHQFDFSRKPEIVAQARKEAWERFMHPELEPEITPEPEVEEAPPVEEEAFTAPEHAPTMRLGSFTLNFDGPFDREALCNSLAAIIQGRQRVKLEIKCELEGD